MTMRVVVIKPVFGGVILAKQNQVLYMLLRIFTCESWKRFSEIEDSTHRGNKLFDDQSGLRSDSLLLQFD